MSETVAVSVEVLGVESVNGCGNLLAFASVALRIMKSMSSYTAFRSGARRAIGFCAKRRHSETLAAASGGPL
jgi:hypothetical protein